MPSQFVPVNRKASPFDEKSWDMVNLPLPRKTRGLRAGRRRRHRRLGTAGGGANATAAPRMLLSFREEAGEQVAVDE